MVADVDCLRHGNMIRRYMLLRTNCTFGDYLERFDHPNTVGWSFSDSYQYDNSMAVVLTNGDHGRKWLGTGRPRTRYRDFTDALQHTIVTNNGGWAEFECPPGNTSIWVEETKYAQMKSEL